MATEEKRAEVEQLKQREDVRRALKQASATKDTAPPAPPVETKEKFFLGTYIVLLLALGAVHYLLNLRFFGFAAQYVDHLKNLTNAAMAIVLILAVAKLVSAFYIDRLEDRAARYNLSRVFRLITSAIIVLVFLSIVFANWYTTLVSVGVLSVILGLALQNPATSFFGWIYLLIKSPYRVGDRIRMGDVTGDVIDVGYLDTTLWEFGGEYLSTDHPSGRLIKFPNSKVFSATVINYSWPLFPYIWNEVKFQVAYDADLEFIAQTMQEVTEAEIGEAMMERVKTFRELLAQTPVDQLEVRERPSVLFRVSDNTWLEAIVRYVVPPREAGRIKTRLIKKLLERLNAEPDKVCFPKSNMR